jgi:hypothetical protein
MTAALTHMELPAPAMEPTAMAVKFAMEPDHAFQMEIHVHRSRCAMKRLTHAAVLKLQTARTGFSATGLTIATFNFLTPVYTLAIHARVLFTAMKAPTSACAGTTMNAKTDFTATA